MGVDARTVNDVKITEDGATAIISREGASDHKNGLVILDVSNPTDGVRVIARYDDQLNGGVHNVFIHLYKQGREIAFWHPYDPKSFTPNAPNVWGVQPYKGNIFLADHTSGLWAVKLVEPKKRFMGEPTN